MEGKLAKHSDFFPIIEFLHLKSLNSNSQQFHVLLLRFEILTVTDRSASQAGWKLDDILLLYCLIITKQYTLQPDIAATDTEVSYPAGLDGVLNCGKSST